MNTFLVILWVVGIVVVVFGMLVALLAMNWSTRDNTAETMVETLLMSVSIIWKRFRPSTASAISSFMVAAEFGP